MDELTIFVTKNFLEDMGLVLCVAALSNVVCQFMRLPLLVGYLLAGMVVGPHVPGIYANVERIHLVSDLGVTVLVFAIGLHFRFRRLLQLAPTAGLVALVQAVAMVGLGCLVGRLMGWTPWECLIAGAMLSISGVVIIAKAFEEVPVETRVRELVFGVVMCEDVIAILMLAMLLTIAKGGGVSFSAFIIDAAFLALFIVGVIAAGVITVPYVLRMVARFKRPETLLIISFGLCFGLAMLAERAGYSMILGAFLAGSLVAESAESSDISKMVEPVGHIFGALFFVSVGMLIDPLLLLEHWPVLVLLSVVVVVGKMVSVFLASLLIGERINIALKAGAAMGQIGIFAILVAKVGSGTANHFLESLAVGTCAITAFLCPFLIRASNSVANIIDRHRTKSVDGESSPEVVDLGGRTRAE